MDRRIVREPVWNHEGTELEISVTKKTGCHVSILKAIKGQMDAMQSYYSKVLIFRLDLHVNDYSDCNKKLSRMMDRLKEWIKKTYNTDRVGSVWVREQEKAKQQHYHLVIMIDGRVIQYPAKVIEWIERYWLARDEPKPYTPRNCYTIMERGEARTYKKAFFRASYLAKARGKGYKGTTANNYSVSRIKPKEEP